MEYPLDRSFIRLVASDNNIHGLSDQECDRIHSTVVAELKMAALEGDISGAEPSDYYYALRDLFN